MKKLGSNGYGAVELILVVIIVMAVGGTGYYVYNQRTSTSFTQDINSQSEDNKNISDSSTLKEYLAEDYGFKFSYPAEYGNVEIRKSEDNGKAGKAYDICIGFCDKLSLGFVTRDWVPTDKYSFTGFTEYNECKDEKNKVENSLVIYSDRSGCFAINGIENYSQPGAQPLAQKKFSDKSKYAGIELRATGLGVKDYSDDSLRQAYKEYIDYEKIIQSFEEL